MRDLQKDLWMYDVFVCHAGPDKHFARALRKRLPQELRCFVDEDSLFPGEHALQAMKAAAHNCQVAVVLLGEQVFRNKAPQEELRWILADAKAGRTTVVPVFLGVTVEECAGLAKEKGLQEVCDITGLRHICKRNTFTGKPVSHGKTLKSIIDAVRELTGI